MKLLLKDFQIEAVRNFTDELRWAANEANSGRLQAVSLSAPTGSGKTVMAAAAIGKQNLAHAAGALVGTVAFESASRDPRIEEQIRQEYAWVPEPVFASKRIEILRSFLARKQIFSTEWFRKNYEQQARRNLETSISKLEQLCG